MRHQNLYVPQEDTSTVAGYWCQICRITYWHKFRWENELYW